MAGDPCEPGSPRALQGLRELLVVSGGGGGLYRVGGGGGRAGGGNGSGGGLHIAIGTAGRDTFQNIDVNLSSAQAATLSRDRAGPGR